MQWALSGSENASALELGRENTGAIVLNPPLFDAYHLWLGIPPKDQPPDAYRILGVSRFESDPKVLDNAMQLRLRHLAAQQPGPHAAEASRLSQEVRQTGATLLNSETRARYDARLRQHIEKQEQTQRSPVSAASMASPAVLRQPDAWARRSPAVLLACGATMLAAGVVCGALVYSLRSWLVNEPVKPPPAIASAAEENNQAVAPAATDGEQGGGTTDLASTGTVSDVEPSDSDSSESSQSQDEHSSSRSDPEGPDTNLPADAVSPGTVSPGTGVPGGALPDAPAANPDSPSKSPLPTVVQGDTATVKSDRSDSTSSAADPFATWPTAVELPALLVKQPRSIGSLSSTETIELEVDSEFAKLEEGERIISTPVDGDSTRWRLLLTTMTALPPTAPPATGAAEEGVELAQLALREDELQFVWSEGAPVEKLLQVKNCILNIASERHSRSVSMRTPLQESSFTVSLAKKVDIRVLDLPNLPDVDNLRLHADVSGQFPVAVSWKEGQHEARKGAYLTLQLTDYPGAEIRFKVDRKGKDEIAIYVMPVYNPNARISFDLSIDRLQNMEKGTQRALLGARRDLTRNGAKLSALKSRESSINAQRATTVFQRQAKAAAQFGVQRDLASTSRKINSAKAKISEMEARLKSLPEAQKLVTKIHDMGHVSLRVFCEGEQSELPLYVAADKQ